MPRSLTASAHALGVAALAALTMASLTLAACEPPPAKMVASTKDDGVPANSASEARLAMEGKSKATSTPAADDATLLTTALGPPGTGPAPTDAAPESKAESKPAKGGAKASPSKLPQPKETKAAGGKVSKAECGRLFERYIELSVATDDRFEGIPPEMIAALKQQALQQAQQQKGDPCATQEVTRAQYSCAIAAPTTSAWQRCMK